MSSQKRQNLLLLKDIFKLGKSGQIVKVKSGFARNFLIPQKIAVFADKNTIKLQDKLIRERAKQSEIDKDESKDIAKKFVGLVLVKEVKVDPEGKMYGSVGHAEILELLEKEGISIDKRFIQLKKGVKNIGVTNIELKLKEGVTANFDLKILPEGTLEKEAKEEIKEE